MSYHFEYIIIRVFVRRPLNFRIIKTFFFSFAKLSLTLNSHLFRPSGALRFDDNDVELEDDVELNDEFEFVVGGILTVFSLISCLFLRITCKLSHIPHCQSPL